jgi:hypothetical protein
MAPVEGPFTASSAERRLKSALACRGVERDAHILLDLATRRGRGAEYPESAAPPPGDAGQVGPGGWAGGG